MKKTTALRPDAAATPRRSPAPMPGRLPVSDITARTARSLYAEARRYESWARNIADGHTNSTDSNGRVWTLDEIHAHVWECRKAGNEAERAENAPMAAKLAPRTASVVPMPGRLPVDVLDGFARRINKAPDRVFTHTGLLFTLTMSARLTHNTAAADQAAYHTWMANRRGTWHTREARESHMKNARDFADYVWDEASADAECACALLLAGITGTVTAAQLVTRIGDLTAEAVTR
ncbi:hypothetical protein [Streptomyces violaceusniger]|uniref:hypothetical protein n=1 Tax=Streptomyces violaceusniger TaxID=68280 RepID=UPI0037FE0CD4